MFSLQISDCKDKEKFIQSLPIMNTFVEHFAEDILKVESKVLKDIISNSHNRESNGQDNQPEDSPLEQELAGINIEYYIFDDEQYINKDMTKAIMGKIKPYINNLYKFYSSSHAQKKKQTEFVHAIMMESGNLHEENRVKFEDIKRVFKQLDYSFYL